MKFRKSTMALATLIENPTWTDDQVAEYIGVKADSLRKMKGYQWALQIMHQRPDGRKVIKNARTGVLDMYEDNEEVDE